jgi:DNA polymerase-1
MAHFSLDPVLVSAFRRDLDVHAITASELLGVPLDQVGPEQRRLAKAVNYGLIYGQSGFGLSRALGISRDEARAYIDRYFERFSGVQRYLNEVIETARRDGVSRTLLGRIRPIPELSSRNFQARSAAERIARNTPLQGSGADILKLAMLRAQAILDNERLDAKMVLTVHDELVFEVAADRAQAIGRRMKAEMEGVCELAVPLRVDVGVADDWAGAH